MHFKSEESAKKNLIIIFSLSASFFETKSGACEQYMEPSCATSDQSGPIQLDSLPLLDPDDFSSPLIQDTGNGGYHDGADSPSEAGGPRLYYKINVPSEKNQSGQCGLLRGIEFSWPLFRRIQLW
ncbi:MAG: hypothetical protein NT027_20545 [Proteobacteria bacterium]|nr:hypothetical protein [Pseudomonadota bacterium]